MNFDGIFPRCLVTALGGRMAEIADTRPGRWSRLYDAWRHLGFFWWLFGLLFGLPSIISLLQTALTFGDLHPAIQSTVDAYNNGIGYLAGFVEPSLRKALIWIADALPWTFTLHAHWRHVFVLLTLVSLSRARAIALLALAGMRERAQVAKQNNWKSEWKRMTRGLSTIRRVRLRVQLIDPSWGAMTRVAVILAGLTTFNFLVAIAIGLISFTAGWMAQGLIAAFGTATFFVSTALHGIFRVRPAFAARWAALAFVCAAAASFVPWLQNAAALLVLGTVIVSHAILVIFLGLRRDSLFWFIDIPFGLTLLGPFLGAAVLLGGNWLW